MVVGVSDLEGHPEILGNGRRSEVGTVTFSLGQSPSLCGDSHGIDPKGRTVETGTVTFSLGVGRCGKPPRIDKGAGDLSLSPLSQSRRVSS